MGPGVRIGGAALLLCSKTSWYITVPFIAFSVLCREKVCRHSKGNKY